MILALLLSISLGVNVSVLSPIAEAAASSVVWIKNLIGAPIGATVTVLIGTP